jgi:UDP-glucose 4-epimerase
MKIVVTGATGNVGTSVISALSADPAVEEILGLARRVPSGPTPPKTVWGIADVSRDDLVTPFRGADVVIHLAWLIQPSRDERVTRAVNVTGSERVFEAVARAEVPALVHASSVGAYGPGPVDRAVGEDWPTTGVPSSFYSRHKAEVERALDDFQQAHAQIRVVRLRPALCFKAGAATGIRRLFIGPLLPGALVRPDLLPVLPLPRGLRTQAVHSEDAAHAYRLAALGGASGAFNVAADPVLDAGSLGRALKARPLQLPPRVLRALVTASWKLRLQPTPPGWLDMGMLTPLMSTARAREELGWAPARRADDAVLELLDGLRGGADTATPPLEQASGGPLRSREVGSGVGGSDGASS